MNISKKTISENRDGYVNTFNLSDPDFGDVRQWHGPRNPHGYFPKAPSMWFDVAVRRTSSSKFNYAIKLYKSSYKDSSLRFSYAIGMRFIFKEQDGSYSYYTRRDDLLEKWADRTVNSKYVLFKSSSDSTWSEIRRPASDGTWYEGALCPKGAVEIYLQIVATCDCTESGSSTSDGVVIKLGSHFKYDGKPIEDENFKVSGPETVLYGVDCVKYKNSSTSDNYLPGSSNKYTFLTKLTSRASYGAEMSYNNETGVVFESYDKYGKLVVDHRDRSYINFKAVCSSPVCTKVTTKYLTTSVKLNKPENFSIESRRGYDFTYGEDIDYSRVKVVDTLNPTGTTYSFSSSGTTESTDTKLYITSKDTTSKGCKYVDSDEYTRVLQIKLNNPNLSYSPVEPGVLLSLSCSDYDSTSHRYLYSHINMSDSSNKPPDCHLVTSFETNSNSAYCGSLLSYNECSGYVQSDVVSLTTPIYYCPQFDKVSNYYSSSLNSDVESSRTVSWGDFSKHHAGCFNYYSASLLEKAGDDTWIEHPLTVSSIKDPSGRYCYTEVVSSSVDLTSLTSSYVNRQVKIRIYGAYYDTTTNCLYPYVSDNVVKGLSYLETSEFMIPSPLTVIYPVVDSSNKFNTCNQNPYIYFSFVGSVSEDQSLAISYSDGDVRKYNLTYSKTNSQWEVEGSPEELKVCKFISDNGSASIVYLQYHFTWKLSNDVNSYTVTLTKNQDTKVITPVYNPLYNSSNELTLKSNSILKDSTLRSFCEKLNYYVTNYDYQLRLIPSTINHQQILSEDLFKLLLVIQGIVTQINQMFSSNSDQKIISDLDSSLLGSVGSKNMINYMAYNAICRYLTNLL